VFGQTCGDCRLLFFCRRATGAASARPSLRPPTDWGRSFRKARARIAPRDGGPVSSMRCLRCEAGFGREAAACERGAVAPYSSLSSSAKADDPVPGGGCYESRGRGVLDSPPSRRMTGGVWQELWLHSNGRAAHRSSRMPYPSSTASAASTASAPSVTVFSSDGACTAKVSAKNRASAT
jgi:hypothetical protein